MFSFYCSLIFLNERMNKLTLLDIIIVSRALLLEFMATLRVVACKRTNTVCNTVVDKEERKSEEIMIHYFKNWFLLTNINNSKEKMRYNSQMFPFSSLRFSCSPEESINNILTKHWKKSVTNLPINEIALILFKKKEFELKFHHTSNML